MRTVTVIILKVMMALVFAAFVGAQAWWLPAMAIYYSGRLPDDSGVAVTVAILGGLFLLCLQVVIVCVWRLLSMVATDSIFTVSAFGYVNVIIGAVLFADAVLAIALVLLRLVDALAPGLVAMLLIAVMIGLGLALLVAVMKSLLRKAAQLEQDLAEVV